MPWPKGRPQPVKTMLCPDCGKPVTVNVQKVNAPRCTDCSVEAMVVALYGLTGRSGPAYERLLRARRAHPPGKGRGRGTNKGLLIFPGRGHYPALFPGMMGMPGMAARPVGLTPLPPSWGPGSLF